jgi:hypothetical protein
VSAAPSVPARELSCPSIRQRCCRDHESGTGEHLHPQPPRAIAVTSSLPSGGSSRRPRNRTPISPSRESSRRLPSADHHGAGRVVSSAWSNQFALKSPKQSPPRSVPADDRFRTHDYNCVLPIEQTGQEREADTRYRINPPRLDPLTSSLPMKSYARFSGEDTRALHAVVTTCRSSWLGTIVVAFWRSGRSSPAPCS